MGDRERIGTAFHEAGHATMGLLLRRPPKAASIVRDGHMAGAVTFDKDRPQSTLSYFDKSQEKRLYLEMRVMITLAGTVAHDIMEPGRAHDVADKMDRDQAIELLEDWEAPDDERAAWLDELASKTRETLVANRSLIERISVVLLERETLSREDLLALLGQRS
jgi:ATP-dependent Zn protease